MTEAAADGSGSTRTTSSPLRVCVIGAGVMGFNHARVLSDLRGADLAGVLDSDRSRAEHVAERFGCRVLSTLQDVIEAADAASVSVTTSAHVEVGMALLEAGVPCLVEKPLATNEADCLALIGAAESKGVTLAVGHIERFNPAVRQLKNILSQAEQVRAIDVRRLNAVKRILDVDVVMDLMVHDIDIVLDLLSETPDSVTAKGVMGREERAGFDYVTALLGFPSGAMATLSASRITQNKIRTLEISTETRWLALDYPGQELLVWTRGALESLGNDPLGSTDYVLEAKTERVYVRRAEPLALELAHFVDVVQTGRPPAVSGTDALAALRVAWAIQDELAQ